MKYKEGDKVFCKKELKEDGKLVFLKGTQYEIVSIDHEVPYGDDIPNVTPGSVDIGIKSELKYFISHIFSNCDNEHWLFDDYFITLKEMRKMKLKKLKLK